MLLQQAFKSHCAGAARRAVAEVPDLDACPNRPHTNCVQTLSSWKFVRKNNLDAPIQSCCHPNWFQLQKLASACLKGLRLHVLGRKLNAMPLAAVGNQSIQGQSRQMCNRKLNIRKAKETQRRPSIRVAGQVDLSQGRPTLWARLFGSWRQCRAKPASCKSAKTGAKVAERAQCLQHREACRVETSSTRYL